MPRELFDVIVAGITAGRRTQARVFDIHSGFLVESEIEGTRMIYRAGGQGQVISAGALSQF